MARGEDGIILPANKIMDGQRTTNTYNPTNKDMNHENRILKQISQINFSALTLIAISTNNIESIESLNRVDMPVLKSLWLGTDHSI